MPVFSGYFVMLDYLLRFLAFLPLAILRGLGALAGMLLYALPGRYRRRLRAHARQAGFGSVSFAWRAAAHTGMLILEIPWVWHRSRRALKSVETDQTELLQSVYAQGRPVIFLTPHLGNFELGARYAAQYATLHVLYRPPRQASLRQVVENSRERDGVKTAPTNRQGIRQLLQALRRNEQIGILPDQVPGAGEGAWADFFGRPAYTATLPARLAQNPDAIVLAAACQRRRGGWTLHLELVEDRPGDSPEEQAAWVNRIMQRLILRCPEQYLWSYHRYKNP